MFISMDFLLLAVAKYDNIDVTKLTIFKCTVQ